MDMPKVDFKNLKEIKAFIELRKTDTSNYFANLVKDSIKIIGKELDVYYYNSNTFLWCCVTKEVYESSIADYFNDISKTLFKCFQKFSILAEDADVEEIEKIAKLRKAVQKKQDDLDSTTYIKTIVDRSTGKLQDNAFATKLDSAHDYLPIRNGKKICLINGKIEDRTKEDLFTFECDCEIVDETPQADKFFSQVMPDKLEREYLRKVLGYLVTGSMDARNFFIWYGDGSNGKTVVMNLLKTILKKLYHQTSKGIFMKGSRENTEGASPDKIALIGVRCAVYSEGETSDDIDINESLLKMISGKDAVNARALFRAPLTFYPCCKLTLLTNYKPDLNGDKSIKERIRYIFFKSSFVDKPNPKRLNEFKNDPDFVESLNNEYLSEVFTWIMKGSQEYYKDKKLTPPQTIADMTASVFEQQDSITAFLKNRIEITDDKKDYIKKSDMMDIHYKKYCNDNSLRCHPRSTLYKRLEDIHLQLTQLNGYTVYRSVKLKEPVDDPIDHADYDNGVDKVSKSIDITTECVKELNILKNDMIDIKKKINKMPPIIETEKKPTKKNKNIKEVDTLDLLNS